MVSPTLQGLLGLSLGKQSDKAVCVSVCQDSAGIKNNAEGREEFLSLTNFQAPPAVRVHLLLVTEGPSNG